MTKFTHLGTIESVQFPDYELATIPAKIDTGADSSAIWASQIAEHDDILSFVLFHKSSPYYNGRRIRTSSFKVTSVKNSFGQSEVRYKVKLKITIGGRTIKSYFTLANREYNRYPVLIGRRTLSGKFLVDVSQNSTKQTYDILLLSTRKTAVTEKFVRSLEQYGQKLHFTYASYDDLSFDVGGETNNITIIDSNRDIGDFDLVYFKTLNLEIAPAVARYLQKRNVPFIDNAALSPNDNKLFQYCVFADNNIPIPRSIFLTNHQLEMAYDNLVERLGLPFVLKDIHGRIGQNNYLITDKRVFLKICKLAKKHDDLYIAQSYIQNDFDYRVLVFGARVSVVIRRARQDKKTHLNNTSQGGQASLVQVEQLSPEVQSACVTAAKLMDRQVAGVDIIQDKTNGLWYCLEVNAGPQLATGGYTAEKQAALAGYLERKLTK